MFIKKNIKFLCKNSDEQVIDKYTMLNVGY